VEPPDKTMLPWKQPPLIPHQVLMLDIAHAVQRDDYAPDKTWNPQASGSARYAVQRGDYTKQPSDKVTLVVWNPQTQRSIGYTAQRDDHTNQPPDKVTRDVWKPRAQKSIFLGSCITKLDLLPCKNDMTDAYSSLPTAVRLIASGLCLAYFLASHPGLWPWSRADLNTLG
jgi:hypothetical protein